MDLQHSSPLKHHQTLFLKLNWHDLPQTTSSDEKEVMLHVWKDFNSREEELSNTQSATPHGWVEKEDRFHRKHESNLLLLLPFHRHSSSAQNWAKGRFNRKN